MQWLLSMGVYLSLTGIRCLAVSDVRTWFATVQTSCARLHSACGSVTAVALNTGEAGREALMVTAVVLNTGEAGREALMVTAVVPSAHSPSA